VEAFEDEDVASATEPDGMRWEWYRILEDSETFHARPEQQPGA
jgi:hypothetical protein